MKITFIGLTITSSWGNGHATTYRALLKALAARGHDVCFLECDKPWYARERDMICGVGYQVHLYRDKGELERMHRDRIAGSDLVVLGSYTPEGAELAPWLRSVVENGVFAFYDIDTPITLLALQNEGIDYLKAEMISEFDLYLSFSGGMALEVLEEQFKARFARPLYCSVDPDEYHPEELQKEWALGYLGTYSTDRQPTLEQLLLEPARSLPHAPFVVAGPGYPDRERWPANVHAIDHLPPAEHRRFYNRQHLTLNVTRSAMVGLGHSPSVRLFEAAACGTAIMSDPWRGLDELFTPGEEILIARNGTEALEILRSAPDLDLTGMGSRARARVLKAHTAAHRAFELEQHYAEVAQVHSGTTV
jgi:spore maturation protein CgeB